MTRHLAVIVLALMAGSTIGCQTACSSAAPKGRVAEELPWGETVRGIAARVVPNPAIFKLGETPVVVLELKRATEDGQVPSCVSLKKVSIRTAMGGAKYHGKHECVKVKPVGVGETFARMRVSLAEFGFHGYPWINADGTYRIGYGVGFDGGKAVFATSQPFVARIDTDMKALDAHVRDLVKRGSKDYLAQVARIPKDVLKDNPEDYLWPLTLHQFFPMPYRQDAGYYYGRRLAQRHLAKGIRKEYVPRRFKGFPFMAGFLLGYKETMLAGSEASEPDVRDDTNHRNAEPSSPPDSE